jgi:hypothetical protein
MQSKLMADPIQQFKAIRMEPAAEPALWRSLFLRGEILALGTQRKGKITERNQASAILVNGHRGL